MLKGLYISNYALIDELSVELGDGLTVLTGETGSGKSIVLGALSMLLGERADHRVIRNGQKKSVIEATFVLKENRFRDFFRACDIDFEELCTIRREIATGGKSRAFINDTPVQLSVLKEFTSSLIDIHSQHENSMLGSAKFSYEVLDGFAHQQSEVQQFSNLYHQWRTDVNQLQELKERLAKSLQEQDYLRFQWQELDQAKVGEVNVREMEEKVQLLRNSDDIIHLLNQIDQGFDSGDSSLLTSFHSIKSLGVKLSQLDSHTTDITARLESVWLELKDIHADVISHRDKVNSNPELLTAYDATLSELYRLQHKHRLAATEDLISLKRRLEEQLQQGENLSDDIIKYETGVAENYEKLKILASHLSSGRRKAAVEIAAEIQKYLRHLRLENAEMGWHIQPSEKLHALGNDELRLMFRANPGSAPEPIQKVASGGEISRVMLAIKAAVSAQQELPVLVLDEIDAGVSGEAGVRIGQVLRNMSSNAQLIVVTHLPQIAGQANYHFKVSKSQEVDQTLTHILPLKGEARAREIAEMLGGSAYSDAALQTAQEMLAGGSNSEA
jgi:DNA repair protein RecN (Recombination protein N)